MTKLTFTRPSSLEGVTYADDWVQRRKELRHLLRNFKKGDPIPMSVGQTLSAILAEKTNDLCDATPDEPGEFGNRSKKYFRCMKKVLKREPFLEFTTNPLFADKEFSAIRFVEAQEGDDHADA